MRRSSSSVRKRTLCWSRYSERLIRRPPASLIPRQFLNESLISFLVGMLVMVLSQFCTFTVCRAMSITSPSALSWGISIQSPTRTMSLELICRLATSDRMVSWNTRISTAIIAPSPDSRINGERSINVATISTPASVNTTIFSSCR